MAKKTEIIDYSKWAGAGRTRSSNQPASRSIYPEEMESVSYCYVVNEFKKDEEAIKIFNSAPTEAREKICSEICKLGCFPN